MLGATATPDVAATLDVAQVILGVAVVSNRGKVSGAGPRGISPTLPCLHCSPPLCRDRKTMAGPTRSGASRHGAR